MYLEVPVAKLTGPRLASRLHECSAMPPRRRASDATQDIVIVQTTDGRRFRCSLSTVGRETEPRWMLLDAKGEQFAGPLATSDRTPEGVRRQIEEWWTSRSS